MIMENAYLIGTGIEDRSAGIGFIFKSELVERLMSEGEWGAIEATVRGKRVNLHYRTDLYTADEALQVSASAALPIQTGSQ
jgi:hypothetical protein